MQSSVDCHSHAQVAGIAEPTAAPESSAARNARRGGGIARPSRTLPALLLGAALALPTAAAADSDTAANCHVGVAKPGTDAIVSADAGAAPAPISEDNSWEPTPFSASYEVNYDGIPFSATGTRSLEADTDGTLHFSSRVRTWLLKLKEEATMQLTDAGALRPLDYAYRMRGIVRRTRYLEFDWAHGTVYRTGDKSRSAPLEAPAFDPVSWQLALQRDLARGASAPGTLLCYPIADGGEVKVYEIIVRGSEQLELATGTEQTVFLERLHDPEDAPRSTRVWLAPARDWLLVKLEVVDDDGRMLQLSLKP